MRRFRFRTGFTICTIFLIGCSAGAARDTREAALPLAFSSPMTLGDARANPAAPFLRYAPDGRLFAVWTEDHDGPSPAGKQTTGHPQDHAGGKLAPSPMRNVLIAWSSDSGATWSTPGRVNREAEAAQGEENGPKIAFDRQSRAHVVWSIPGTKGNKTRANVRYARENGGTGFTPARTLNEIADAARFPAIEAMRDGSFLIGWIDRRIDNPKPRQLYLMKMSADGESLTANYPVGAGLCECCKLGIAFGADAKTVYLVDRQVDGNQVRNHVLRKSTDGAASFAPPVEISDDGWQVPSCPHSGPSITRDRRGWLHVTWFTLGRSEKDAGIYYSVSKDGGMSFAPRRLVHANSAPEILYNSVAAGPDDTVYLAWTNLDSAAKSQVFVQAVSQEGRRWSEIQQISDAKGNATRPALAVSDNALHAAWTETDGESSRIILRTARVGR